MILPTQIVGMPAATPKPRLHRTIPSQIADALAVEIIEERYAPGSRLNEVEIAERWGVSRSPVREALHILEKRGLVVITPQRGARVTLLSEEEVEELFEIREALVGLAAKKAANKLDGPAAAKLDQALQSLENFRTDPEQYGRASASATILMAQIGGNQHLIERITSFADQIGRYARLGLASQSRRNASLARWRRTFALIKSGDGDRAEQACRQQLLENRDEAVRVLRNRLDRTTSTAPSNTLESTMEPSVFAHPSAWKSEAQRQSDDWLVHLDEYDIAELESALARVKSRGLEITQIKREDFVLPRVAAKMSKILAELEDGRGFVLIRGLPVERYSKSDAAKIYWGLGAHLGPAFAQNAQGEMLGHVRDLGANWKDEMNARGYQTRLHLPFHNDSTDVVGLLCLQKAKSGGASRIVSSSAVHNEFALKRPDLWAEMCRPFCVDRRGEESAERKPYYVTPCFNYLDGRLFVRYNRTFIESAQRFDEVPRLTAQQREAMDLMDALCNDPAFYLDIHFEPGDMQFLNNYFILHSRGDYEDWPEPERKRHLLRLWLRTPRFERLPDAFADRNADMLDWAKHPKPPVFDASDIEAELAH